MTNRAAQGRLPWRPFLRSRWAWWAGFVLLLGLGAPRIVRQVRTCFVLVAGNSSASEFFDFYLLMGYIDHFTETGVLYDTTGVDPYGPITSSMLKYPPPHAAFGIALRSCVRLPPVPALAAPGSGDSLMKAERRAERRRVLRMRPFLETRPFFLVYLTSLVAALGLVLAALKPGWRIGGLITLVFLNWQPHWESIEGPGIESLLLLLFAASLALLKRGRVTLAGIPIGLAGSLKVYPWGAGLLFLLSRRGRWIFPGIFIGTVLAFAAATFVVPVRVSLEYLIHILPRVGGGSGLGDNLSALGNVARLTYALRGEHAPVILPLGVRELLDGLRPPRAALEALVLWIVLGLSMLLVSLRALRRAAPAAPERHDLLRQGLTLSLMVLLMPTAWSAYQTVLLLPLGLGFALAPPPDRAKLTWGLLLFAAAAGAVNIGSASRMSVVVLRSLIPFALWLACLRLLAPQSPAAKGPAATSPAASVSAPGHL